ncbi:NADP-dependent oxidoreductase [Streptomyces sp. VRA16 Mangrove soil]|uniref:NADP-dependent oxidoreductase n=1 Tax=Streptomyces sp. VRA16 Mangrove soil TaxID=2817434 RepID=UPI001A9CEE5E|nr:NADP-dependent oxidoreductase [Streptomyces sp. VRA16 Mangrove soil]MBO1337824.1 NADP-dependent oxidoreductase [Streptomyces sp. VRA16 Mangrove soil]
MRAAVVTSFGGPEAVEIVDVERPEPGAGQIRVKVAAATLNPVDAGVRSGIFGGAGRRLGLGWDVAGTVDAVGVAAGFAVGDEVVALFHGMGSSLGTHADHVVVDASAAALAPAATDPAHAATLPLNALTAAQALDLLALEPGQSLLVTGAAGAVGGYAIQLAAHRGIEVTAYAGEDDEELLRGLGATHFVPRGSAPARPADAVLDAAVIGAEALSWVRDEGRYAGVIPGAAPASERGVRTGAVEVAADGRRLAELVRLAQDGVLTTRVAQTYALTDAEKAHARLAEGGVRGRLVLIP